MSNKVDWVESSEDLLMEWENVINAPPKLIREISIMAFLKIINKDVEVLDIDDMDAHVTNDATNKYFSIKIIFAKGFMEVEIPYRYADTYKKYQHVYQAIEYAWQKMKIVDGVSNVQLDNT